MASDGIKEIVFDVLISNNSNVPYFFYRVSQISVVAVSEALTRQLERPMPLYLQPCHVV